MKKFFIGIDFAKTKFDVVVLSKDDLVSKGEYNQFCNTKDGVKQLEKCCARCVAMTSSLSASSVEKTQGFTACWRQRC